MKTFPQPLEAEEEQYYLQRLKEGDGHARDILVEHNLRLVAHIVKKYQGSGEETEDLISIGTITFANTKGSRLATYAARCVENELLMYFRSKKKTARETSYYDPIGTDKEGNEIHLLDIMESGERDAFSRFCLKEDSRKLYALLGEALTERERTVLIMRYGLYNRKEYTQREIAQMLGISRSYISRIEKNALQKLREHFLQE